eukprot:Tbor_TRINITY_DN5132_c0_g1::TRINITY_DN5132_c0_g1_i1::g.26308::m.26308
MHRNVTRFSKGVVSGEVGKFRDMHRQWWDPNGPLSTLHMMNPVRVSFIRSIVESHSKLGPLGPQHRVLDVGCGGGILTESLGRLGANTMGVDACQESIAVARQRLENGSKDIAGNVSYSTMNIYDMLSRESEHVEGGSPCEPQRLYDVVVCSEVLEHVDQPAGFLKQCCELVRPDGLLIISTMDKTLMTAISHVLLAEYVTGLVPVGTHDWRRFIPPDDVARHAARNGVYELERTNIIAYPDLLGSFVRSGLLLKFELSKNIPSGHYFWAGVKASKT